MVQNDNNKQSFFDKFQVWMQEKIVPVATKIGAQRHLSALRDGLTILVPFTIIGGLALMIATPPVDLKTIKPDNFFNTFLISWKHFADTYNTVLNIPYNLTIGIISIYVVLGVSYRLAQKYKMDAFTNSLTALFTFFTISIVPDTIKNTKMISLDSLGANSMFSAIIIALAVIEINKFLVEHNIRIKMPSGIPPMVAAPFEILIPMITNMFVFMGINEILKATIHSDITKLIFTIFQPVIHATSSLPSMIFIVELTVIFWFFGIHGDNMVSFVTTPIFTGNLVANLDAYQKGQEIPNIVAGNFTFIFGLAIVYLAILFNMNVINKNKRLRALGHMAIPSSLFNINEPLVFGVPTVLNVMTFIPSLICIPINIAAAYILTDIGFIAKTTVSLPWTMPAPLYAILSTMDWHAGLVWIVLLIINIIIFIPFMKAYEKELDNEAIKDAM